jgi:hypothetical protein
MPLESCSHSKGAYYDGEWYEWRWWWRWVGVGVGGGVAGRPGIGGGGQWMDVDRQCTMWQKVGLVGTPKP